MKTQFDKRIERLQRDLRIGWWLIGLSLVLNILAIIYRCWGAR